MPVYAIADHILCSLGDGTTSVWNRMLAGESGVKYHNRNDLFSGPFWASLIETDNYSRIADQLNAGNEFTRFETICLHSIKEALGRTTIDPASPDTVFILSTTKGNIDLLEKKNQGRFDEDRLMLWKSGRLLSQHFGNTSHPIVISNACISGVLSVITAFDLLKAGHFRHAVVCGADIASEFVISGFQSFKSLANGPCKPFDASREGLNLGEGVGTLVLSVDNEAAKDPAQVCVAGGGSGNDANHISGPSRTGEGLYVAIQHAMNCSGVSPEEIGFISAHGTATPYNDEMESKAFSTAGLGHAPLNSMKAYFGHTLGAAGVIETIIAIHSMKEKTLLRTLGYSEYGVPEIITILDRNTPAEVRHTLKTASGFGGCNAALVLSMCSGNHPSN